MSFQDRPNTSDTSAADQETLASQTFLRKLFGPWSEADELDLKSKLASDSAYTRAFQHVEQSWAGIGKHSASAELIALREQALARARRSNSRRWRLAARPWWRRVEVRAAAVAASLLFLLTAAYQWAPFGLRPGEYRTTVAEQRMIELEDHSRIALDAATLLKVRFSDNARIVELIEGQAQFSVARDPQRPFKVQVGERTIVALGTKFTVEYIDREFNIAMFEGRVAVISDLNPVAVTAKAPQTGELRFHIPASGRMQVASEAASQSSDQSAPTTAAHLNGVPAGVIELSAGEGLQIDKSGQSKLIPTEDLKAFNAWREGKVIFNGEPLQEASRRLNRYSSLRIEVVDPKLASMRVSGVFDVGDAQAFVEAVQGSIAVDADYSEPNVIRLRAR